MRVAYLVNQYPKVSHSFIRREILALERRGIAVARFAVRGWDEAVVEPQDQQERDRTRYLMQEGVRGLFLPLLRSCLGVPRRFGAALILALRMGKRADRPWPY